MVSTRKRSAAADEPMVHLAPAKRKRKSEPPAPSPARGLLGSPQQQAGSPPGSGVKRGTISVTKKGSRGAAYLAAAGAKAAAASASCAAAKGQASPAKEAKQPAAPAANAAPVPPPPRSAAKPSPAGAAKLRNPLLRQELPAKLLMLADMFAGLQTVYEMMKRRGQRVTYQTVRAAVEEASGRRFLLTHVYQLKHLLPEMLELEWVRLPVAAHSSRTEPALSLALHAAAAAKVAVAEGAAPGGSGELQAARRLLHCRLAAHLLGSYRQHLTACCAALRSAGDDAGAAAVEEAAAAAEEAEPLPLARFLAPYPEEVSDVPQQAPPPLPTPARGGSPAVLVSDAAAAAQAALPLTPTSTKPQLPASTTGRAGRPPVHPSTVDRHRQRRLSFGAAAAAAGRASKPGPPLDKLAAQLDSTAQQVQQEQQQAGGSVAATLARQLHPAQAALAASLSPADLASFGGSVPSEAEAEAERAAEEARLLASMPEELRRYSSQGIITMETLRALEVSDQQARRLSSTEAVAAREASAALGELPKMFPRLQRIFGMQGPVALKMRDVVLRIKQGGCETSTLAHIEASLRALAEHAPEYLTIKPYGSSDKAPALWINRKINPNSIMARLQGVADARHAQRASVTASIV